MNNYLCFLRAKARKENKEKRETEEWKKIKEEFKLLLV